jgi:hypothetical protein
MNPASLNNGNTCQGGITAALPTINQPSQQEKADCSNGKVDSNHQIAAMQTREICVKNASPPHFPAAKTFSGRGATPHRR